MVERLGPTSVKTETITFRPRNGLCAQAYWQIRYWCQEQGFSFSDIFNAILPAYSYYLHNHCQVDKEKQKATVELNIGSIDIHHIINGKCYPLISETNVFDKKVLSLEEIQHRINYWLEQNRNLSHSDLLLLNDSTKNAKKPVTP
jgi:hypothetical protein